MSMRLVRLIRDGGTSTGSVVGGEVEVYPCGLLELIDGAAHTPAERLTLLDEELVTVDGGYSLGRPLDPPEVWAAGVTYERSREARVVEIHDSRGRSRWAGETSTSKLVRTCAELRSFLLRCNPVPPGSLLLTGTGLVPPDDVSLAAGDVVSVSVEGVGTLRNSVVTASSGEQWS